MAPSCFKVLLDPSRTNSPLSPDFVTRYVKDIMRKNITIRWANGGHLWNVKIKKIDESYCLTNGWSNVVQDAQMGHADFLIFKVANESTFKMRVYSPNGCEKILPPKNHAEHSGGGSDDGGDGDPFFESIISKSRSRLPKKIVGLPGIDREGTIILKNLAGKEWKMGVRLDKSFWTERYHLSREWGKFRRCNKLSEGDKCVFKCIKDESKLCLAKVTKGERGRPSYQPAIPRMQPH